MAIARISGPLLASNLVRTQSDLKFETDLLHIGSSNTRICVRTDSPTDLLQINGCSGNHAFSQRFYRPRELVRS